jgi:hypothetical protein
MTVDGRLRACARDVPPRGGVGWSVVPWSRLVDGRAVLGIVPRTFGIAVSVTCEDAGVMGDTLHMTHDRCRSVVCSQLQQPLS